LGLDKRRRRYLKGLLPMDEKQRWKKNRSFHNCAAFNHIVANEMGVVVGRKPIRGQRLREWLQGPDGERTALPYTSDRRRTPQRGRGEHGQKIQKVKGRKRMTTSRLGRLAREAGGHRISPQRGKGKISAGRKSNSHVRGRITALNIKNGN